MEFLLFKLRLLIADMLTGGVVKYLYIISERNRSRATFAETGLKEVLASKNLDDARNSAKIFLNQCSTYK